MKRRSRFGEITGHDGVKYAAELLNQVKVSEGDVLKDVRVAAARDFVLQIPLI